MTTCLAWTTTICVAASPTYIKRYDEATAVLAGDGLQTAAFHHPDGCRDTHEDAVVQAGARARLSQASGARGMAGGQMIDLPPSRAATEPEL
jgi:farnesyl diphosphate synthase